jgi:hypothetical protein
MDRWSRPNKFGYDPVTPVTNDWGTKYSIPDTVPPHLAKGGGDHHLKKSKPGHNLYRSFLSHLKQSWAGGDLATCHPELTHPCVLD